MTDKTEEYQGTLYIELETAPPMDFWRRLRHWRFLIREWLYWQYQTVRLWVEPHWLDKQGYQRHPADKEGIAKWEKKKERMAIGK